MDIENKSETKDQNETIVAKDKNEDNVKDSDFMEEKANVKADYFFENEVKIDGETILNIDLDK